MGKLGILVLTCKAPIQDEWYLIPWLLGYHYTMSSSIKNYEISE